MLKLKVTQDNYLTSNLKFCDKLARLACSRKEREEDTKRHCILLFYLLQHFTLN